MIRFHCILGLMASLISTSFGMVGAARVNLKWADDAIVRSSSFTVFEGLPHPFVDRDVYEAEKRRVPTVSIGGHPLYGRPLALSQEDRRKLQVFFIPTKVIVPPPVEGLPPKLCGGFHSDYGLRWEHDGAVVLDALICFSCHEVCLVRGEIEIYADLTEEGYDTLKEILTRYRQERPRSPANEQKFQTPVSKPELPKVEYKR
jgi:hypothetical protein